MSTVSSVVVRPDGWSCDVTIAGWSTQAGNVAYDFDANGTPKFVLTVVSEGYDATGTLTTTTREVYGTKTVRLPYSNEASLDEVDSGSDLVIRVALSDHVYNDDKNGGAGTSGTDPTVAIAAGCFDLIVGSDPNTAVTAGAVTNNSTLDYPKVIGQWDLQTTPMFDRVASDFQIGFIAYHGFQVAAVTLSAIGATSAHSQAGTATAPTVTDHPTSGLKSESYKLSVPIAGYTQGENITLRAIAYPKVGDADSIIDTNDLTAVTDWATNKSQITCTCDKTGALVSSHIAYVSTTGANPGTVGTDAAAQADPFLTVAGAVGAGARVIYVESGTFSILGATPSAPAVTDYWVEVRPATGATVILNRDTNYTHNTQKLAFKGPMQINQNGWLTGDNSQTRVLKFEGVTLNPGSPATVGLGYRSISCVFKSCTIQSKDDFGTFGAGDRLAYSFVGCLFSGEFSTNCSYQLVGCKVSSANFNFEASDTRPTWNAKNIIVSHCDISTTNTTTRNVVWQLADGEGYAWVSNVLEITSGTQAALYIYGDNNIVNVDNIIVAHSTWVGQRINFCYNDTGSLPALRTNVFFIGNSAANYNIKTDTFSPPSAGRVGNWAQVYGVNYKDNRLDATASGDRGFANDFDGINTEYVDIAVLGDIEFVDNAGQYGTGLGNGDYTPADPSVLRNNGNALLRPIASYDLFGTPVSSQIGAVAINDAGGGPVALDPSGLTSSTTLGIPALTVGEVALDPSDISLITGLGTPTLTAGNVLLDLNDIVTTVSLGTPIVTQTTITELGVLTAGQSLTAYYSGNKWHVINLN